MDLAEATLHHLLEDVRAARSAGERAALVRAAADGLGLTVQTVYRRLKSLGWESGRKPRRDRGTSALAEEDLHVVARVLAQGRNKRGQPNVPLTEAHRLAQEQGLAAGVLSRRQLARRLNQEGLGLRHMRAAEPSIQRVSLHPNHVWLLDVSVAIQWYFRDPANGKVLDLYDDAGARFYEGKRANLATIRRVIHRYTLVDHYSGAFLVQYRYSSGERAEDVVQTLWAAMAGKDAEVAGAYPFRGVPRRLVTDQGSAFKAGLVVELLSALGVEHELHGVKNPKASGAVEKAHDTWQRRFEARLTLRPAQDLEQLNAWALRFCALANAERPHSRHGHTPIGLWASITPEQLVEAPDRDTFFALASTRPKTGTLDARHWLSADGRKWLVRGEGVHGGQKVSWRLAPFVEAGIRVWDEFDRELAATELEFDVAGFASTGRRHVWDSEVPEERGSTAPSTPAQVVARVSSAEPVRIEALFDDLDQRLARHATLNPGSTPWRGSTPLAAEPPMGSLEAREEVARRLGRPLGEDGAWWRERIGDGVTASELEALWAEFLARPGRHTNQQFTGRALA